MPGISSVGDKPAGRINPFFRPAANFHMSFCASSDATQNVPGLTLWVTFYTVCSLRQNRPLLCAKARKNDVMGLFWRFEPSPEEAHSKTMQAVTRKANYSHKCLGQNQRKVQKV